MQEQEINLNDGRTMRERMLAGDLYIADDPQLGEDNIRAQKLAHQFNHSDDRVIRQDILKELLGSIGDNVEIRPPLYCDYGYQIEIGSGTFVNFGVTFLDVAKIRIGEDVQIGPHVQFLTPTHPLDPELRRLKYEAAQPITVGNNVWFGGGAIVLPGVSIGDNTVVGAGAVVTKDLPANVVAVGNPAKVIRHLESD